MANLLGPAGQIPENDVLRESIWRSPMVYVALAVSAGMVLDRAAVIPFAISLLAGSACLAAFVIARLGGHVRLAPVYLALAGVALGSAYHHFRRELYDTDDVGQFVSAVPAPVRVRGRIEDEPRRMPAAEKNDPLRTLAAGLSAATVLEVSSLADARGERAVTGRARLFVSGEPRAGERELLSDIHPGDEVEIRGRLLPLAPRANPGEFDLAGYWADRGVRAMLQVHQGDTAVRKLHTGWTTSPSGWLAVVRGWGHRTLDEYLPDRVTRGVARALLLGEGAPMTTDDWAKYVRTGVVHVLAISGEHLVVVGMFLWWVLRLLGVRQRRAAVFVAIVLLGYALLTGGRPPAMRAGIGACVLCGGLIFRRPTQPANLMALGWLIVVACNPADMNDTGCQLSFLAVAVLCWGASRILRRREEDPLDTLVDRSRPIWVRALRRLAGMVVESYLLCLIVWVAITPLAAYHTGLVAPVGLLLAPPLTLLASLALYAGFALLLFAPWFAPGAALAGWVLWCNLAICEWLVDLAESWPIHLYVGQVPLWWSVVFYLLLLGVLTQPALWKRWRLALPVGLGWLCVGLASGAAVQSDPSLRCTFLAVGHGGCIVFEMPDGRVLLYDTGAMRGPDVAARVVAPFLWSRKIHRIDDVVLSHGDQDHFNGLADLADRFSIGRVLCSSTFEDKATPGIQHTLRELRRRGVPIDYLAAGQRLLASGVVLEVLHPPAGFQGSNENARSIVLEIKHGGHTLLLTGDLEGEGLAEVLTLPRRRVDVLMAPHHGSHRIDVTALATWCRPGLVVSCQGAPRGSGRAPGMYRAGGAEFWSTHENGAIEIRSDGTGLSASAFVTGRRWRPGVR